MFKSFPKIFALGSKQTQNIFEDEVEITEKIDGSQIGFGMIDGELRIRSKGCELFVDNPEKMFKEGIEYINSIKHLLPNNIMFYGEYLKKSRHNALNYDSIPRNHIALYGAADSFEYLPYSSLLEYANLFTIDIVPCIYSGKITSVEEIKCNLDRISYLGGSKIEGLVVKNYHKNLLIGGQVIPLLMGKYVSEQFKEVAGVIWNKTNTGKGRFETYKEQFKTKARWEKAIQHLRDRGELTETPADIGKLLKELNIDIEQEEKENIKEWLWDEFGKEILRFAGSGFPQYYKDKLLHNINPGK